MTSHDIGPPGPISSAGTLANYSDDLYRHFFEVSDMAGITKEVFLKYLGTEHSVRLRQVKNGYDLAIPIQCAPELVRLLTEKNIAVYQVVRLEKSKD